MMDRPFRQCFRLEHADKPPSRPETAFHLVVVTPTQPHLVELALMSFFTGRGLIGIDYTDIVEACYGPDGSGLGWAEILCSPEEAPARVDAFVAAVQTPPRSILMSLTKRHDLEGENVLVDVDDLAQRMEPVGSTMLYQADVQPYGFPYFLLIAIRDPMHPPGPPT